MKTWDRSNPYEGPELCVCGHDYGVHSGSSDAMECLHRKCDCQRYELAQDHGVRGLGAA